MPNNMTILAVVQVHAQKTTDANQYTIISYLFRSSFKII